MLLQLSTLAPSRTCLSPFPRAYATRIPARSSRSLLDNGFSIRVSVEEASVSTDPLFCVYVFTAKEPFSSGGGGIRTLDTPLRGMTDDSFAAVRSRPIFPLPKPNSRGKCYSLFTVVSGGLVY
jgi:hypothetical protein